MHANFMLPHKYIFPRIKSFYENVAFSAYALCDELPGKERLRRMLKKTLLFTRQQFSAVVFFEDPDHNQHT